VLRKLNLEDVHRFFADPRRQPLDDKTVSNLLTPLIAALNLAVDAANPCDVNAGAACLFQHNL
jgi:hypothetical protein